MRLNLSLLAPLALLLILGMGCATPKPVKVAFDTHYTQLNAVLSKHVSVKGVDYAAIAADPSALNQALAEIAQVPRGQFEAWSNRAQMAFLVNAHNAGLMARIARDWPVKSLGGTSWLWPARGRNDIEALGRDWSLAELEGLILGPRYLDSRGIFLISRAQQGAPRIPPVAVTEENLNDLADRQTRAFLADPANMRYDAPKLRLYLSPLLLRHRESIERDYTTIWIFLERYLPARESGWMKRRAPRIRKGDYNKALDYVTVEPPRFTEPPIPAAP